VSKILITGLDGFVGRYLARYLDKQGHDVRGYDLNHNQDIRNFEQLRNCLDDFRPDKIFHLAALAYVPESTANPVRAIEVNVIGSVNLLEAVRQLGIKAKIHMAGTSEEYGDAGPNEEDRIQPLSPYAIGKSAMDYMGQLYARAYGMEVVVTRAFNHCGPGRGEMYAESSFAKQIVEVEMGKREVVKHGNLESIRNYTDVRDIVQAYALAIDLPSGVYNICSENNVAMQEIMDRLIKHATVPVRTESNPALYRPSDFSFKKPSCKKFTDLTDWKPTIELDQTLADILQWWRERLA
jgi:GDP-4-dehydro-6-deoxy-D-mannose reductase